MGTIIILIIVVLGLLMFFLFASKKGEKMQTERKEKINRAEDGKAKILSYDVMGLRGRDSGGRYQAYRFNLEVTSNYKSPYKTESIWNVYEMGVPNVQDGKEVNVKIDADDPNVIYPAEQGVAFSWNGKIIYDANKK